MVNQLRLGEIAVDVVLKDIKNVHLSVYPPTGRVRISAPQRMKLGTIRLFAISKLSWIKQQQTKVREQERETPREYLDRESHYVWGKRYLLKLVEEPTAPRIELKHNKMILRISPGTNHYRKEDVVAQWYREQIKAAVPALIAKWEPVVGVNVQRVFVQKMKTQWGSCNPGSHSIRLNTDLAKKPRECLQYIVVHEMVHILEPTHNAHFVAAMDRLMPQWRVCRDQLNRLPVCHEKWDY
jgi:predicted metal-dependent hydrolase